MNSKQKARDLFLAIACCDATRVADILNRDHDLIHCRDEFDNTPLIDAAERGQTTIVKLLLEFGADTAARNYHWYPLEAIAKPCESSRLPTWDAADLLLASGAPIDDIFAATRNDDPQLVRDLLDEDPSRVDERDEHGNTALFVAAWKGYPEIVRLLVEADADASAICQNGQTPLTIALNRAWENEVHREIIDILLDYGASYPSDESEPGARRLRQAY